MYRGSTDTEGVVVNYKKVLKGITGGNWRSEVENLVALRERSGDDYSTAKKLLPSVTFSGTFSQRGIDYITGYSQMIVIDIDKLSPIAVNEYKEAFKNDGHIHACFISPSGAGLKILIRIECQAEHHLAAFLSLEQYFLTNYAIAIDKSGKDVSRLCYVSYDPDCYVNYDSVTYVFDIAQVESTMVNTKRGFDDRPDKFKGHVLSKDAKYAFKVCEVWTQRNHQYEQGNRNNYIHVLACNMNRVGIDINDASLMVYNNYGDMKFSEIDTTINSAYRNTSDHNTIDVYDMEKGNIPDDNAPEGVELTKEEDTIFEDTLEMLRKDVKRGKIGKLLKCYGHNFLGMDDDAVSRVMNMATEKFKKESEADTLSSESATDSLMKAIMGYQDNGGVPTGVSEFDEILGGGLMPGQLYGMIGVGGSFKSLLAHCVGADQADAGGLVLYLNGEMSTLQLMDRVVNKELGVELIHGLKNKSITEANMPYIIAQLNEKLKDNFQVVNGSGWTQDSIVKTVDNIEKKYGKKVSLIIADGLTQMDDTKKDEIKSAIFNSGELKECAKRTNSAIIVLVHTSGVISKHTRNTANFVRGGTKVINNFDAMFCTSLLIDETESNMSEGDLMYRNGIFYVRLIDKRGSGLIASKIIQVHRPLRLEPLSIDPSAMEVKIS